MAATEKSLAVECMHRLSKHIKDLSDGKTKQVPDEYFTIFQVWDYRKMFEGDDLNSCLAQIQKILSSQDAKG